MEQKCIKLVNFTEDFDEDLLKDSEIIISHSLKYFLIVSSSKYANLYSIPGSVKLWVSQDAVDGCIFSDDGSQILVILKTKSLQIFKLKNKDTKIISEANSTQLTAMLVRFGIQLTDTSLVWPLKFSHQQIILLVDCKWIVGLKWLNLNQLYVTYTVETGTSAVAATSHDRVHLLTSQGSLSGYSLEDGKLLGTVNLNSALRSAGHAETLSAPHQMSVSADGSLLAVASQSGAIAFDMHSFFRAAAAESAADTTSLGSTASWASTRTVGAGLDPRRRRAPHRATWEAHVKGLRTVRDSSARGAVVFAAGPPETAAAGVRLASATAAGIGVWLDEAGGGPGGGTYRTVDAKSGAAVAELALPANATVVAGGFMGVMDAVVTPAGLSLVLGSIERDKLVRKLLAALESRSLRYLVRGDECGAVAVPIAALNDCLRQRSIDVARLALAFNSQAMKSALLVKASTEEASALMQARFDNAVSYMEKMFHSIHLSIQANTDQISYSQQLIHASLDHATEMSALLADAELAADAVRKQVLAQAARLRGYLKVQRDSNVEEAEDALTDLDPGKKEAWLRWRAMEAPHVIRLAVTANQLPVAHTYLANSRGWTPAAIAAAVRSELAAWREQLLAQRDFDALANVIANTGGDRVAGVREIAEGTTDGGLRDDLIRYLLGCGELTEAEIATWNFVLLVEQAIDTTADGGAGRLTLNDFKNVPVGTRSLILHEIYFNVGDVRLVPHLDASVAWKYLLISNRVEFLLTWVRSHFDKDTSDSGAAETEVFSSWPVTQPMVDAVLETTAKPTTQEAVLDRLCAFGVFPSRDAANAAAILKRAHHAGLLESLPALLSLPSANVTPQQFKMLLTKRLIGRGSHRAAFACLSDYSYSSEEVDVLTKNQPTHWFRLWLTFRELDRRPDDSECFYKAVLDSCVYFSKGDLATYLKENPILAIALIYCGKLTIKDVLAGNVPAARLPDFPVTPDILRWSVAAFPLLEMSLSPCNCLINKQDITFYELLRCATPFDLTRLMRFLDQPERSQMPHFSSPRLVKKYGHRERLTFLHYLAEARPTYAVHVFTSDHADSGGKLSKRDVREACSLAHGLALQRLADGEVSAGCVALTELLGQDSAPLRVHLSAANAILAYFVKRRDKDAAKKVESLLYNMLYKSDGKAALLAQLETALMHECPDASEPELTVPAIDRWSVCVQFARQHQLPLPELFLRHCAARDLWLAFVLFIEINNYPLNQALELVKCFESPAIRENLAHALANELPAKTGEGGRLVRRDPRTSLYSRIGLKPGTGATSPAGSPPASMSQSTDSSLSLSSCSSSELPSFADRDEPVLCTLLRCQRSADPPRALLAGALALGEPALAAMAECLEPGSVLACFCTFVLTSLGEESRDRLSEALASAVEQQAWDAQQVTALLVETVASRNTNTLATAFRVFLPDCPLCPLSKFLDDCIDLMLFKESIMNIKLFIASCLNLKSNPSIADGVDVDGSFLVNGHWVAATAVALTNAALSFGFDSAHHQMLLMQTLTTATFGDHLPVNTPDYAHFARLVSCLSLSGVHLSLSAMCGRDVAASRGELQRCLDALTAAAAFPTALAFARLAGLNVAATITARWMHQFKRGAAVKQDPAVFWQRCEADFEGHAVPPTAAAAFFHQAARIASSARQRYDILQLAIGWLRRDPTAAAAAACPSEDELEMEMWKSWLALDGAEVAAIKPGRPKLLQAARRDILRAARSLAANIHAPVGDGQHDKLDRLIGEMLDLGNLATACKVESMFGRESRDLRILLTMLGIAEGETSPYDLPPDLRLLLSTPGGRLATYRRRTLISARSNASLGRLDESAAANVAANATGTDTVDDGGDVTQTLDALSERLVRGRDVGSRVALCYRISAQLDMRYLDVIARTDPLRLVPLLGGAGDKFALTGDVVAAWKLQPDEVSAFLCSEIVAGLREPEGGLWGADLNNSFHLVLGLCGSEPTGLGTRLFAESARLAAEPSEELREAVELLIRAHDCFSAACNVEGISRILQQARQLNSKLLKHQRWLLMVRLLTGIGRYTEMGYVFSMLKKHEHFEFLLGKGMDKVAGLKQALLDFLRRHCPDDKDLYRMVALHFSLFEELAELWLAEAEQELASLTASVGVSVAAAGTPTSTATVLTNDAETRRRLVAAAANLGNAARHFLRADRLTRAAAAARRAELAALQTALLAAVPAAHAAHCVLGLDDSSVAALVTHTLSFPQAWILTQAYGRPVDWTAALYQHWVVKAEPGYLPDFLVSVKITPTLIEDVVKRFLKESKPSAEMSKQMKALVSTTTCIETKYRLASQLGFKDVVDELLSDWELAYLKDTVWKSGYTSG